MAFPASTEILSRVLDSIAQTMLQVKSASQQIRNASASGPIGANSVITYLGDLADQRDRLTALAAAPGLAAYAQAQYNNGSLNIATEYNAVMAATVTVRDWIIANFPKDGSSNLLEKKFDANGRVTLNTFTSASLATFRTQLDALIATIN